LKFKYSDDTNINPNWGGSSMIQVKVFDYEHEKDLEKDMNHFLSKLDDKKIVDIKYHVAALSEEVEDQIYCFSAMVVYRK
jgi:Sporulation protein Cse60